MAKNKGKNKPGITKAKVQLTSETNGITEQNQNQGHNVQKEALGPNTKR